MGELNTFVFMFMRQCGAGCGSGHGDLCMYVCMYVCMHCHDMVASTYVNIYDCGTSGLKVVGIE